MQSVEESKIIAATDALEKQGKISNIWIMLDKQKNFNISNELYYKEQGDNKSGVAKTIVLLELVAVLERTERNM